MVREKVESMDRLGDFNGWRFTSAKTGFNIDGDDDGSGEGNDRSVVHSILHVVHRRNMKRRRKLAAQAKQRTSSGFSNARRRRRRDAVSLGNGSQRDRTFVPNRRRGTAESRRPSTDRPESLKVIAAHAPRELSYAAHSATPVAFPEDEDDVILGVRSVFPERDVKGSCGGEACKASCCIVS